MKSQEDSRNGNVESDLAGLDVLLKVPCRRATLRERRRAVAVCDAHTLKSTQPSRGFYRDDRGSHLFLLMSWIAPSSESALTMTSTGPKISSLRRFSR